MAYKSVPNLNFGNKAHFIVKIEYKPIESKHSTFLLDQTISSSAMQQVIKIPFQKIHSQIELNHAIHFTIRTLQVENSF